MTQLLLATNNAQTTLGSALASGSTSLTVATGTGDLFPNPNPDLGQYFRMTLWSALTNSILPNEIVTCTARSGDTMTVARGQEGTTALNWNIGDNVANFFTAGDLAAFAQQDDIQTQQGNFGVDSGSANAGVVTLIPVPPTLGYLTGAPIRVQKVDSANTGAYTLDVNALGNVPVVLPGGAAFTGGELPANGIFTVVYDGTSFELQSIDASAGLKYAQFQYSLASGTNSAETLTADEWNPRNLTVTKSNTIPGLTLVDNLLDFAAAGVFEIDVSAQAFQNTRSGVNHTLRLYDVTATSTLDVGTAGIIQEAFAATDLTVGGTATLSTVVSVTAGHQLRVDSYLNGAPGEGTIANGTGGQATGNGVLEVYVNVRVKQL